MDIKKRFKIQLILVLVFCAIYLHATAQTIINIAGSNSLGHGGDGGPATAATLNYVYGITVDSTGNVCFADYGNNCIRRVSASGIISTIAGNGTPGFSGDGGAATAAQLQHPYGITTDRVGNIYIADLYNETIRKVNTFGIITTIAGAASGTIYAGGSVPATDVQLVGPSGVAVDNSGNVYIADYGLLKILKVNTSGILTTVAGTGGTCPHSSCGDGGPATAAEFNFPYELSIDNRGNIFVSDEGDARVRKINTAGIISTQAGNDTPSYGGDGGPATAAELSGPTDIAFDSIGNMYIADDGNFHVRKVNTAGIITTSAGNGFPCVFWDMRRRRTGNRCHVVNSLPGYRRRGQYIYQQ